MVVHPFREDMMGILSKLFGKTEPETIPQLGRNDPCWCGSGKKYKKCHMELDIKKKSRFLASTCTTPS